MEHWFGMNEHLCSINISSAFIFAIRMDIAISHVAQLLE